MFEYAPSEVKLAFTGSGRATKDQMLRTARLLLGAAPGLSDEADALAVAVCHLARRAGRLAVPAPRNVAVAVPSRRRARAPGPPAPPAIAPRGPRRGCARRAAITGALA